MYFSGNAFNRKYSKFFSSENLAATDISFPLHSALIFGHNDDFLRLSNLPTCYHLSDDIGRNLVTLSVSEEDSNGETELLSV